MNTLINEQAFEGIFKEEVQKFLQKNKPLPRTARLTKETRDNLFHGKGNEWIRTFIFDQYPEVNELNGGWVLNPRKTENGKTTSILVKPAIEWLNKHEYEIDWNAKLPNQEVKQVEEIQQFL